MTAFTSLQLLRASAAARLINQTTPPGPGGDPFFDDVAFLSGFNGADDARPLDLDESGNAWANTWTGTDVAVGSLETSVLKFGSASLKMLTTADQDYPEIVSGATGWEKLRPDGEGDYTWEGFFRITAFNDPSQNDICSMWNSNTDERVYIVAVNPDRFRFFWNTTGSNLTRQGDVSFIGGNISVDTWYHFALVLDGTAKTFEVFLDGVSQGTDTLSGGSQILKTPLTGTFRIGQHEGSSQGLNGYVDELRLTKGVKRYTADFTVPTSEYPRTGTGTPLPIDNFGFENGNFAFWDIERGAMSVVGDRNGLLPQEGSFFAAGGTISIQKEWAFRTQDVPTTPVDNADIDAGSVKVTLTWYQANAVATDVGSMMVELLDGSSARLSPLLIAPVQEVTPITTWEQRNFEFALLPGTRNIRIYIGSRLFNGTVADTCFDNISMVATANDIPADDRKSATVVFSLSSLSPPSNVNEAIGTTPSIANMVDQDAAATGWSFGLTGANTFGSPNNGGAMPYNPLTLSELWSRGRNSATSAGGPVTMRIGGLAVGGLYDVEIFGSRDASGNRNSLYTIGASSQTVDGEFNIESIIFPDVVPDGSGNIDVTIETTLGSAFSYITTLKVSENSTPPPPTDPFFANVTFLSSFDGTQDERPLDLDESTAGLTNFWAGDPLISSIETTTPPPLYGTGIFKNNTSLNGTNFAGVLNANAGGLTPDIGGDFTWEMNFYLNAINGQGNTLLGWWEASGNNRGHILRILPTVARFFLSTTGGNGVVYDFPFTFSTATWYHIAWVITGGTSLEVFVDGVSTGTQIMAGNVFKPVLNDWKIGAHSFGGAQGLNGYLEELRITKGVARYNANFTPPTKPYPRSGP